MLVAQLSNIFTVFAMALAAPQPEPFLDRLFSAGGGALGGRKPAAATV